jgi:hypothetical protein
MEQQDLLELTNLIDDCNYNKEPTITVNMLHERLWSGLNKLRTALNKDDIIPMWKYGLDFINTEKNHANNNQSFTIIDWEKSFVMEFWMGIYH